MFRDLERGRERRTKGTQADALQRGANLLTSLDALIHAHREDPLTGEGWDGQDTVLLGTLRPHLPSQDPTPAVVAVLARAPAAVTG